MMSKTINVIIVLLLFLSIFTFVSSQSAYAFDGSRFSVWLIFSSGLGSSFAGAILQGQANKTYDEYLHTAVQSDMNRLIDDYNKKHQQSLIASRAGIGLTLGAILLSFLDMNDIQSENKNLSSQVIDTKTRDGDIIVAIKRGF